MTDLQGLPTFEVAFTSSPTAVRTALAEVLDKLRPLDLDADTCGTVEIVLAEALNNIVEHAYPETGPAGPVRIACTRQDADLHFQLIDHGHPMPNGRLPNGAAADLSVGLDDLPEGGFGWFLIRHLTSGISYCRRDDSNVLDLRLSLLHPA